MNWKIDASPDRYSASQVEESCEHIEAGAPAYRAVGEQDSFGIVCLFLVCKECYEKGQAEEGAETVVCHDCKQEKLKKETAEWKWYDFYAPQGDVPLIICDDCWAREPHLRRMRKDNAECREELYGESQRDEDE